MVNSASKTDQMIAEVEANKPSENTTIIETEAGSVVNEMPHQSNVETRRKQNCKWVSDWRRISSARVDYCSDSRERKWRSTWNSFNFYGWNTWN